MKVTYVSSESVVQWTRGQKRKVMSEPELSFSMFISEFKETFQLGASLNNNRSTAEMVLPPRDSIL